LRRSLRDDPSPEDSASQTGSSNRAPQARCARCGTAVADASFRASSRSRLWKIYPGNGRDPSAPPPARSGAAVPASIAPRAPGSRLPVTWCCGWSLALRAYGVRRAGRRCSGHRVLRAAVRASGERRSIRVSSLRLPASIDHHWAGVPGLLLALPPARAVGRLTALPVRAHYMKRCSCDTSFGEASSRTQATDPTGRETLRIRTPFPGLRGKARWLRRRVPLWRGVALRRGVPKL